MKKILTAALVAAMLFCVATGALAATNSVTAPIIEAATIAAQNAARTELLPEADSFSKVEGIAVENVSDVYVADNGTGAVITSAGKGYGGTMTVMVAFTPEGTIKQLKVTEAAETKGIGSNVSEGVSYWENYTGKSADKALVLGIDVDAYTGATISSKALNAAVNSAIEAYNMIP